MASFDILSAANSAYKTSWQSRDYLFKLALFPIIIKLFCFTIGLAYAGQDGPVSHLRFMLIMVPALMAEGWMLSHYTRFIVLGQTWPFRASGDFDTDMAVLAVRARGVLGGMVVFVLINMVVGGLMALTIGAIMPYIPESPDATVPVLPAPLALASIAAVPALFWAFRLFWLYIPYALNSDITTYLKQVKGFKTSLYLFGAWILCFTPFLLAMQLLSRIVAEPVAATFGQGAGSFVMVVLSVLVDTLKGIVATAGITHGLTQIFGRKSEGL